MRDEIQFPKWDDLIPDALGLIFSNLSLKEMLTVVPRVCKSWRKAISGPYSWQEINLEEWSSRCRDPYRIEQMVRMLVLRSSGSFRKLSVCNLQVLRVEDIFTFIAKHAGSLQTLRIPRTEITDSIVEEIANRFSTITFLDVSCCSKIGPTALEEFGKNCKSLAGLCRNMHPIDNTAHKLTQEDEAYVIATTMPKLRHLEFAYHMMSTNSVLKILSSCPELEYIDLRGCYDVKLDDELLKEKFPKLKVLGPLDDHETNYWEDEWSDDSAEFEYFAWKFSRRKGQFR